MGNGIFSIFLIGYSGNNEIGEAEVGSMLMLPSIMSRTSQETSAIFQRGRQVTLLVRDWRICEPCEACEADVRGMRGMRGMRGRRARHASHRPKHHDVLRCHFEYRVGPGEEPKL